MDSKSLVERCPVIVNRVTTIGNSIHASFTKIPLDWGLLDCDSRGSKNCQCLSFEIVANLSGVLAQTPFDRIPNLCLKISGPSAKLKSKRIRVRCLNHPQQPEERVRANGTNKIQQVVSRHFRKWRHFVCELERARELQFRFPKRYGRLSVHEKWIAGLGIWNGHTSGW